MTASIQVDKCHDNLIVTLWCRETELAVSATFPQSQIRDLTYSLRHNYDSSTVDWQSLADATGWQIEVLEDYQIGLSSCLTDEQCTVEWILRVPYTQLRNRLLKIRDLNHADLAKTPPAD